MKLLFKILLFNILLASIVFTNQSCNKNEFNTDPNFNLEFSNDTIFFDTVFSTIGSSTQVLKVYNNSNKPVLISNIKLESIGNTSFSINIDGFSEQNVKDITINSKDSIYIFAKVTIDPNNSNTPLIAEDNIIFRYSNKQQEVKLLAWGQDAYFYKNQVLNNNVTLPNDKPIVVYGNLIIDTLSILNIEAGTQICFHGNSSLIAKKGSQIISNGTLENPVIFRSDRYAAHKPHYDTVPGQWIGIYIEKESGEHFFNYTEIKNAKIGISIDSSNLNNTSLTLHNCLITNNTNFCIYSNNANIIAANCEISNSGGYLLLIEGGNKFDFRNCTFANYWSFSSNRKVESISLSNYYYDSVYNTINADLENVYFGNCIINGSRNEEIFFDKKEGIPFEVNFENCLIKSTKNEEYNSFFNNCSFEKEVNFIDTQKSNFRLDSLSKAIDIGSLDIVNFSILDIKNDRDGKSRMTIPDAGCYEYYE